jgi:hypothetical protein
MVAEAIANVWSPEVHHVYVGMIRTSFLDAFDSKGDLPSTVKATTASTNALFLRET